MKAILYVGHGTRSKHGAEEMKRFLEGIIPEINVPIQEMAFLELTEPDIAAGFERCVARGSTSLAVVPLFLLSAGHIKVDIPAALEPLKKKYPLMDVHMEEPFGVQNTILDAMMESIIEEAGSLTREDRILIVGRGSSDVSIQSEFRRIVDGIKQRSGISAVAACYLAASGPFFQQGIEEISHHCSGKVIVVPYLLFPGLLLTEVEREVAKRKQAGQNILQTGALSRHESIKRIIIKKATAAGEEERICSH